MEHAPVRALRGAAATTARRSAGGGERAGRASRARREAEGRGQSARTTGTRAGEEGAPEAEIRGEAHAPLMSDVRRGAGALVATALYAAAMGWVEAVVVVYIRAVLGF